MKPLRPVLAAGLLLLAAGCIRKHIEVTVEPRPDGSFVRTLRLWNTDDEKGDAVLAPEAGLLANAAKHYMERTEDAGAAARFDSRHKRVTGAGIEGMMPLSSGVCG